MYTNQSDFHGEITLRDADSIPGFGDITDEVEEKYLTMLLGNEQYQEMYDALLDKNSTDFDKWNEFLNGGVRYSYNDTKITYRGARRFLRYFCYIALVEEQPISAGSDIYEQEVTSARPLEGIKRQDKLNSVYNKGLYYFTCAYWYLHNNENYDFSTLYTVFPNSKSAFGGITL